MKKIIKTLTVLGLVFALFIVSGCKGSFIEYEEFAPFENKITEWLENAQTFQLKLDMDMDLNFTSSAYKDEDVNMSIFYKINQTDKYFEFEYSQSQVQLPKVIVKQYDDKYFIHQIDDQNYVTTEYNPEVTDSLDFQSTTTGFSENMDFRKISENHYKVSSAFSDFGVQIDELRETLSGFGLTENDFKKIHVNLEMILDEENNTLKYNYDLLNFKIESGKSTECKINIYYSMYFDKYNEPIEQVDITKDPYKLSPATSFDNVFRTLDTTQALKADKMISSGHYYRVNFEGGQYLMSNSGGFNVRLYDSNRNVIDLVYNEDTKLYTIPEGTHYVYVTGMPTFNGYQIKFNIQNN